MKRSFFQAAVVSILLYGFPTPMLRKRQEKKARRQFHKNAASNIWTSPGGNTPQSTNYIATYLPSRNLSKLD